MSDALKKLIGDKQEKAMPKHVKLSGRLNVEHSDPDSYEPGAADPLQANYPDKLPERGLRMDKYRYHWVNKIHSSIPMDIRSMLTMPNAAARVTRDNHPDIPEIYFINGGGQAIEVDDVELWYINKDAYREFHEKTHRHGTEAWKKIHEANMKRVELSPVQDDGVVTTQFNKDEFKGTLVMDEKPRFVPAEGTSQDQNIEFFLDAEGKKKGK